MNSRPLVSVITIFFNAARFIEEAIESAFAQTYENWELLLVDDGSSDASTQIALRYATLYPARVRYLEHQEHRNRGMSAARNLGICHAQGEYIAFLDSDDVWLPQKLDRQVAILDSQPEAAMTYGAAQWWYSWTGDLGDKQLDFVSELGVEPDTLIKPPDLLALLIPNEVYVGVPSSIIMRREIVERVGGFEESFRGIYQYFEDAAFLSKVYLKEGAWASGECLHKRRVHSDACVRAVKMSGQYHTAHLFFLNWLERYLSQQECKNVEVWQTLERMMMSYWSLRHPILYRLDPILYRLLRRPRPFVRRQRENMGAIGGIESKSSTPSSAPPAYEGHHDWADCNIVSGWAWDRNQPDQRVRVDIYDGDVLLGTVAADRFRKDLAEAPKGDGRHAFSYFVPYWLKDGKPHWIRAKVAGTDVELAATPKLIHCELQIIADFRRLKTKLQKGKLNLRAGSMNHPLAIFAPCIGGLSESFIRRHMEDLLPGDTVVITDTVDGPDAGHWSVDCPVLLLDRIHDRDYIATLKRFLTEHNVRVLMGEYLNESLPWLDVARDLSIRFFAHAHGYDVSQMLRHPNWRAQYLRYDQAEGIITMSQVSRSRLIDLGLDAAKIHLIPYGVDVPSEPLRRVEHRIVRCLAVGRMVAKKAPILTLDAFRRAAQMCPTLRLDYVGEGTLLPAARQFIHAFKLDDRVTLHGGQPREVVDQLMREADIFLQHSMTDPETGDEEGLPVAILEAMAHGLPVVSSRHAGIPEAVQDGLTGYLVEEGDNVGMADRLCNLARDSELRRSLGEAGWYRAKENFSWSRERRELLRVLGLGKDTKNRDDAA